MTVKIKKIEFFPIRPEGGLIGFASCEIDGKFYLGSLGIYSNLSSPGNFRVTYPTKKLANGQLLKIFAPLSEEINEIITKAISKKVSLLMNPKTEGGDENG